MRPVEPCFLGLRNALALTLVALVAASGCFVTIAEPAVEATGGRSGAATGGASDTGGGSGTGGITSGGTEGGVGGASASGGAGGTAPCDPGFVDCDGKPENGCETDFREETGDAAVGAAVASKKIGITLDGDAAEWSGIRAFAMKLPCLTCRSDQPGGQNGEPILNEPAGPSDLKALYRVAWDDTTLYVLAQVADDQIVAKEATNVERQDGIELLLDGDLNDVNPEYSPDVHHLFVGALAPLAANVIERNQQLQSGDVKAATKVGAHCYSVEMGLSWSYVMGRIPHAPAAGETHGFTIATNDWDAPPGADAAAPPVRQTQYFSVVPGVNYAYETTGFGVLTLE